MDAYSSPIAFKEIWKVPENELKHLKKDGDEIYSAIKTLEGIPDVKYKLELDLETEADENGRNVNSIKAFLSLLNIKENDRIWGTFVFYVKSANSTNYFEGTFTAKNDAWGGNICSAADLFNLENKFIVNGELTFEIKGIIFTKSKNNTVQAFGGLCHLLYNDEDDRDFTIIAGREHEAKTEIKVHKLVLSLRSPVFKRMLKTDMKEAIENKVNITDFDGDTVQYAMNYFYDQEIFNDLYDWERYITLYQFAEKYDIADLKDRIELHSVQWITFENVCEVSNALVNSNAPKLQDLCFQYLLMSMRNGIPVNNKESLNADIAKDLFQKSSSLEYC